MGCRRQRWSSTRRRNWASHERGDRTRPRCRLVGLCLRVMKHVAFAPIALCLFVLGVTAPASAQDRTVALLQQLTDAAGPPGFEEPIRKVMVDLMKPLSASLT